MSKFDQRAFGAADVALILRLGFGSVFFIGGWFKLSALLNPATEEAIVGLYLSPLGYINAFFQQYLFEGALGAVLSPWAFLTALSAFELISGIALLTGFMVRPLALIYGFLLWTFIAALPVTVTPGAATEIATYWSPALLVQVRDIALSGLAFVLFNLGPGRYSVDRWLFGRDAVEDRADWEALGLLTRLSLAAPMIVGGLFAGWDHIPSFATWSPILMALGVLLAIGVAPRAAGAGVAAVMLWFTADKINLDASLIVNLNGFKREFAFVAAGAVLAMYGAGSRYTIHDVLSKLKRGIDGVGSSRRLAGVDTEQP